MIKKGVPEILNKFVSIDESTQSAYTVLVRTNNIAEIPKEEIHYIMQTL